MDDHLEHSDARADMPAHQWHLLLTPVGVGVEPTDPTVCRTAGLLTLWDLRAEHLLDAAVLRPGYDLGRAADALIEPWLVHTNRVLLFSDERDDFSLPLLAAAHAYGHTIAGRDCKPSAGHSAIAAVLAYGLENTGPVDFTDWGDLLSETSAALARTSVIINRVVEQVFDTGAWIDYGAVHDGVDTDPAEQTTALNPVGRVQGTDDETPGA